MLLATLWRISPAPHVCKSPMLYVQCSHYGVWLLASLGSFSCFTENRLEKRYELARVGSWDLRQILTTSTVRRVLKLSSVGSISCLVS